MPNRYEREIEEILRNMERTEPKQGLSDRLRAFNRARPRTRRPGPPVSRVSLNRVEVLLLLGILCVLIGAAVAYYVLGPQGIAAGSPVPNNLRIVSLVGGVLGVVGLVLIILALIFAWSARFHSSGSGGPTSTLSRPTTWRGTNVVDSNVVEIRPRRRNPFSAIATQFRILRLKIRYWRHHSKGDE